MQKLELFLREMDGFTINIPELKLLRQYQSDAVSWISRFDDVVHSVGERDDQESVVDELTCIKKDGTLLKIQGLLCSICIFFEMFNVKPHSNFLFLW